MSRIRILQMFYSDASRGLLDPGFEPLDNSANERPDWREYWPMRRWLLDAPPAAEDWIGFFSPRFREKTRLDSRAVHDFVESQRDGADVVSFSPYYDQSVYFMNPVEQAHSQHPGILEPLELALQMLAPRFQPRTAFVAARDTVFCNYFVARGEFWVRWLELCERLFALAEAAAEPLARALNGELRHGSGVAPAKTFAVERVVSVLLATEPHWRVRAYDPLRLPMAWLGAPALKTELVLLDALKIAHLTQGGDAFRAAFFALRQRLHGALQSAPRRPMSNVHS
jgi:hypothetical protein